MEWSDEDQKRAKAEGWNFVRGSIVRIFEPNGTCVFAGISSALEYIAARAKTSEWHRRVYCSLPWTGLDQHIAINEGWILTQSSAISHAVLGFRQSRFANPQEAYAYVLSRAQEGSLMHAKALAQVAKHRLING